MKIIDNVLNENDFATVQEALEGPEFPWYYNDFILQGEYDKFQFTHTFMDNGHFQSQFTNHIESLLRFINPHILIRVKANLNPKETEIVESGMHEDDEFLGVAYKTAVFYINDNNGYTRFEDDDSKVESVANRLVIFDGHRRHTGTSCTDVNARIIINICYIEGKS